MLEEGQVIWGEREYKLTTRRESIMGVYREKYGHDAIPEDRQFWTLCGQCDDGKGNPHPKSEISQLVSEGFLTEDQFHGVDIRPDITKVNRKAYPGSNWYCGEFYQTMCQVQDFRPAIINLDSVSNPEITGRMLADTMSMLSGEPGPIMLVGNVLMEFMHLKALSNGPERILEVMEKIPTFKKAWRTGKWEMHPAIYQYETETTMATVIFFKS